MPAYWVARSKINDPVEYKKDTDLVPAIIAKFGGKVLARGGRYQVMEGPAKFHRFVVIEFPTFEQGVACFTSPEYDRAARRKRVDDGDGVGRIGRVLREGRLEGGGCGGGAEDEAASIHAVLQSCAGLEAAPVACEPRC